MTNQNYSETNIENQLIKNALYSPIKINFTGLETDQHCIDGEYFGTAINGAAKIFNNVSHFYFTGAILEGRSKKRIRMYARPPVKGSVAYTMWAITVFGEMSLYPQLYGELADFFIPEFVKAVYMKLINKPSEVEKIVKLMQEDRKNEREHNERTQQLAFSAMLQSQDRMLETIDKMAGNLKQAAINSVEPVGKTCANTNYFSFENKIFLNIDEPMAEVIRSKEKLEVDDMKNYKCVIRGVDTTTGNAKLQLENIENVVSAIIKDPALLNAGNIYTNALDNQKEVEIVGKAILKNGKINKIFVNDAKFQI